MCLSFFVILTCGFIVLSLLMVLYIKYLKQTSSSDTYWSYYKVFVYILAMLIAQIISLTDTFFNYSFEVQAWLLALPNTCTFVFITYALSNLIQLDYLLLHRVPMKRANPRFRIFLLLALFCILTQIASPILLSFEQKVEWYPGIPWYKQEADPFYYTRNGLTTVADLIFQFYCIKFMVNLQKRLKMIGGKPMVRIQTRIFFLCVVMEIYLLVYLVLIWLQNMWWYRPSGAGLWIAF